MDKERHEDLMYEAGLTADGCWDELDEYDRKAIVRYGKLVERDCMERINSYLRLVEYGGAPLSNEAIREHFGIE